MYLDLKVIYDVVKHQNKIKKSIRKYGYFAEHNFFHYLHTQTEGIRNAFFDYGNCKGFLMQFHTKNNLWKLFPNGILAPESERLDLFIDAANYILNKQKAKKFVVEVSENLRDGILNKLKTRNNFRACSNNYILYWPMYNLNLWSPELKGSKWKKLRNVRNRFYRMNNVRVKDSKDVSKEELRKILFVWLKRRNRSDKVDKEYYLNLIDNGFEGVDMAKTLYVNNKPCTITAGWRIPNSSNYYSSIGIIDYSYDGLGEAANIDDLNRLKKKDFDYVDFGGSEKSLLYFKKKFKPDKIYKTYIFSIVKK